VKPLGKRQFGKLRHTCEGNIKMDLQEMGCGSMDWIEMTEDKDSWWALVNTVMNIRLP
jgi:hypothetical protein